MKSNIKPTKSSQWELWYYHGRKKKVQSDIHELKANLEYLEAVLEVAKAEKKVEKLKEEINDLWDYHVDPERLEFTERKIVDLEDRSQRNNFCIDGISEKEN